MPRKSDPNYPKIDFICPSDLKIWLIERAEAEDLSIGQYIRKALKAYRKVLENG